MDNLIEFPLHRISAMRLTLDAVDELRAPLPYVPIGGEDEPPQDCDPVVPGPGSGVPAEQGPRR